MQLWFFMSCLMICGLLLLWIWERRLRKFFAGIDTLPLLPFIGNGHQFLNVGDVKEFFKLLVKYTAVCENNEHGRAVIWFGPIPCFVTQNPDDMKTITNTFIEKPYFYNFGKIWLGDALITASGPIWKQNIKKLGGTFTTSVVNGYLNVFNTQAKILVDKLKMDIGSEPFDILDKYILNMSLEAICQTALGIPNVTDNIIVSTKHHAALTRIMALFVHRGQNVFMHPEWTFKLTPTYRETKKCAAILNQITDDVLKKRYRERDSKMNIIDSESKNNKSDCEETKFRSFLDILLDHRLTDQQIKSEVNAIIVAGQDTVSTALHFTLLMVGSNRKIQELIYAELKTIFGDSNRSVTKNDLDEMKYLEAVINETLRLYPPAPIFMRYADSDLQLNSFRLPKGTNCMINAWGAGRSVHIWGQDATLYRPERWLESQLPIQPAAFLAFSFGRRACMGKRYAITMMKVILAHCFLELEFISETDKLEMALDITLKLVSGHLIQVKGRC